MVMSEV